MDSQYVVITATQSDPACAATAEYRPWPHAPGMAPTLRPVLKALSACISNVLIARSVKPFLK